MIGTELSLDPKLSFLEKRYIQIFGVPINGLRIRARRVLPVLKGRTFNNILDAGCGKGVFTFWLAKNFPSAKVLGVDIEEDIVKSNNNIAMLAERMNCSFSVADISNLSFESTFDCIISIDNLEHIYDDRAGALSLYRSLSPGGLLLLHVPAKFRRWPVLKWVENFPIPGHFRPGYTKEEIATLLSSVGFSIKDCRYTYGILETWTNNISYAITNAEQKNRILYAIVFPILLLVSWFGQFSWPKRGAGVRVVAVKE